MLHLGVGVGNRTDAVDVVGMGHDDDLVDALVLMECTDGVLKDGAACYLYELLGLGATHAAPTASGQEYCDVHVRL